MKILCNARSEVFAFILRSALYIHMLMNTDQSPAQMEAVFERVSSYFSVLAEPMRLKILYALCDEELPVAEIVTKIGSTQANVSRHLNLLYRAGVLARRKDRTQVYYRIGDPNTLKLCQTVCSEVSTEINRQPSLVNAPLRPYTVN